MARNLRTATAMPSPVQIEYEDAEFINLSSAYRWRDLKGDVERIKVPITIIYGKRQATNGS